MELALEFADLVLEVDDVIAGDFAAFGRVVVLAVRVCALTGTAAGEARVAASLALEGVALVKVGVEVKVKVKVKAKVKADRREVRVAYGAAAATGRQSMSDAATIGGLIVVGLAGVVHVAVRCVCWLLSQSICAPLHGSRAVRKALAGLGG